MNNEMCVMVENVENAKLLTLFGALEEGDKDMVITMTESLVEKSQSYITDNVKKNTNKREHSFV